MKSRKKKNKLNILLAFSKGIASVQSIELAMLFSHAGFRVNSIFLHGAGEYISSEVVKTVTEHSPWSGDHKPGWLKANIMYPLAIIVEPSIEFQNNILSDEPELEVQSSIFANYIKGHCHTIQILQKPELLEQSLSTSDNKQLISLPTNPLRLRELFEKLLSQAVVLTSSQALDAGISYSLTGNLTNIDYLTPLKEALYNGGITAVREELTDEPPLLMVVKGEKMFFIALEQDIELNDNSVAIFKHKNGLILKTPIEERLLPHFSCQSCFSRLVTYIKTEMTRA